MGYPAYPEMRDSGVPWLGEIPAHWQVDRSKWAVKGCKNGIWGAEPDGENDITCVRVADFDRTALKVGKEKLTLRAISNSDREGRTLEPGDLLIEKSGGGEQQLVGAVVLFNHAWPAVTSNFVARMPIAENMDSRFMTYIHAHLYAGRVNLRSIKQTTGIQNLDSQQYLDECIGYPPLPEQQTIARFLDHKTAQIDALIAKKEALLQKLAEKRTALISQAVTQGLDPTVPMQDSGVAWLGQIPAHWKVMRLRFLVEKIEQGWSPQCENQAAEADEWGVLKVGCVNGEYFDESENKALPPNLEVRTQYEIQAGDILMSRANTKELLGSAAIAISPRNKLLLCDKLYRLIPSNRIDSNYLVRILRSAISRMQYERDATGTSGSMQNIGQDTIKNLVIPVPPLEEQKLIEQNLSALLTASSASEEKTQSAIDKLKEYRAALITAAVTGKIDVRGVPLPAEVSP